MSTVAMASKPATTSGLAFLWMEITGKCNLTCSHCYAESGPNVPLHGAMRHEDWVRVISEAADLGCRELQFIGGEPTMHPGLRTLIARARHKGFELIEVFTNATRLGGDLVQCFREYRVDVASSFYSDDPETHERITGSAGSWGKTVGGFQELLAAGLRLRVGVIEMDQNAGQLRRTTRFLRSLGVLDIKADRLRGVGRGEVQLVRSLAGEFDELCGQCWKGRLCVTPSGAVYPCVFARSFPMGDARDGLATIVASAKLADFRYRLRNVREHLAALNCGPDCQPASDCAPNYCNPDFCCSPNEPVPGCSPVDD